MTAKFSKLTGGIYPAKMYAEFPEDAVSIPDALYAKYINGEMGGMVFDLIDGEVVTVTPPPPPPQIPQSVSPRQARKALRLQNLLPTVQAAIDGADDDTKEAWEYSTSFERNSPFVESMAAILGLTNEELDNLFVVASSL